MPRSPTRTLAALTLCLAAACDGAGTGAEAPGGEYIAALESPNGPEGAAILEVPVTGAESITASSLSLFRQPMSGGTRVVLVREPAGRLEFRVRVAAGSRPPEVRVVEVVDGEDRQRASLAGYTVSFTPVREDR